MNFKLIRLGVFAALGLGIVVGFSFYVNDRPFWYRSCNVVNIAVDDATGLRRKSPVKTLGLDIGYIRSVDLEGESVVISVCVTAPVQLRADTRAYVRAIGVLGDRFLELKPLDIRSADGSIKTSPRKLQIIRDESEDQSLVLPQPVNPAASTVRVILRGAQWLSDFLFPAAHATEAFAQQPKGTTLQASRESEIADTMKKVGKLVDQLTLLVRDIREATSQVEFKDLVVNMNEAAQNLGQLLEPKGQLTKDLRRSMESLRKSLETAEEAMNKVNQGKGTLGKLLNDEKLYDEALAAIKGLNLLLGKAGQLRVFVDLSAYNVPAYDGGKARFFIKIEPNPSRYYLLGMSTDPRGVEERVTTTTIINNVSTREEKIVNKELGVKFTAAFGKYFGPLDLKVGLIENAAALGIGYWFDEDRNYGVMTEIFKETKREPIRIRAYARAQVFMGLYLQGGVDDVKRYQGKIPYWYGAGLYFNDEDIKYLLAFR